MNNKYWKYQYQSISVIHKAPVLLLCYQPFTKRSYINDDDDNDDDVYISAKEPWLTSVMKGWLTDSLGGDLIKHSDDNGHVSVPKSQNLTVSDKYESVSDECHNKYTMYG